MGKLDDLRRGGVPDLDPRVSRITNDDSLSIEDRQRMLDELQLKTDHDDQNRRGSQAMLEQRRRARELHPEESVEGHPG
jgi:hypothetical protein